MSEDSEEERQFKEGDGVIKIFHFFALSSGVHNRTLAGSHPSNTMFRNKSPK